MVAQCFDCQARTLAEGRVKIGTSSFLIMDFNFYLLYLAPKHLIDIETRLKGKGKKSVLKHKHGICAQTIMISSLSVHQDFWS